MAVTMGSREEQRGNKILHAKEKRGQSREAQTHLLSTETKQFYLVLI
jgi:hypothetical protein